MGVIRRAAWPDAGDMEAPLVEGRGLSFSYDGERPVYRDVDLAVQPGEIFFLLGPNGCGKTTLLDTILGIHAPAGGSLFLRGRDARVLSAMEVARILAYVPQRHETSFPYTVEQVLTMGRTPHIGMLDMPGPRDRRIVRETLESFEMEAFARRPYTSLSAGERQLVMIMRALVQEPALVIMDEPTSHLDYANELRVLELAASLVERGLSVVMASHAPNQSFFFEGRGLPTRVAMMRNGGFSSLGSPSQVVTSANIRRLYGVEARVIRIPAEDGRRDGEIRNVVPIATIRRNSS